MILRTTARLNMRPKAQPGRVGCRTLVRCDSNTNNCENNSNHGEAEDAQEGQLLFQRYLDIPESNDRNCEYYCIATFQFLQ